MTDAPRPWPHRIWALGLLILYALTIVLSRSALPDLLHRIVELHSLWALSLYIVVSSSAVGLVLVLLALGLRFRTSRTTTLVLALLSVYWLPHTVLLAFCALLHSPSAWIE